MVWAGNSRESLDREGWIGVLLTPWFRERWERWVVFVAQREGRSGEPPQEFKKARPELEWFLLSRGRGGEPRESLHVRKPEKGIGVCAEGKRRRDGLVV